MRGVTGLLLLTASIVSVGCGDQPSSGPDPGSTQSIESSAEWPSKCVVRLHGKGGNGEPARVDGDITELSPTGNADGWGARQWVYDSDDQYAQARAIVADALDGAECSRAVVNGFSNGGSFAAALYCAGDQFDGRVVGYVIDDPVPDHAVTRVRRGRRGRTRALLDGSSRQGCDPGYGLRRSRLDLCWRVAHRHRKVCRGTRDHHPSRARTPSTSGTVRLPKFRSG